MAVIGEQLTSPEAGWKRYDDTDGAIQYKGSWSPVTQEGPYNKTRHFTQDINSKAFFMFTGTKLRLIGVVVSTYNDNISITIDGQESFFSQKSDAVVHQVLTFEANGLNDSLHTVEMKITKPFHMNIDAIDIDSDGRLLHPDEVLTPDELTIGKRIRCHYSAPASRQVGTFSGLGEETSDFIPVTSSATPNGDFYFIMVDDGYGGKKLIADRNVQHSISWDTLNSAGIASSSGLLLSSYGDNCIPKMTSNTSPSGIAKTSSSYSSAYDGWKAFDGDYSKGSGWLTDGGVKEATLEYEFKEIRTISKYTILPYSNTKAPKSWTFEAWDGNDWIVLDTRIDEIYGNWSTDKREFTFNNAIGYTKYRINITSVTIDSNIGIIELEMMEKTDDLINYLLYTRLLTGGIDANDKDNEWDQYIVNSDLEGNITPGDNGVWNYSIQSWSSTTDSSNSLRRVLRGKSDNISVLTVTLPNNVISSFGFRPVLMVESNFTPTTKYLIDDGSSLKKWMDGSWSSLSGQPTEALFLSDGMNDLSSIPEEAWSQLGSTFDILTYTDSGKTNESFSVEYQDKEKVSRTATLKAVPHNKLIMPTGDIEIGSLEKVTLNATVPGDSILRVIVSGDGGVTWKGKSTLDISDLTSVKANGYTAEEVNSLTKEQLASLFLNSTARFAFYIEQENTVDGVEIDSLMIDERFYTLSPNASDLTVFSTILKDQDPAFYVSRNDGTDWKEITKDELHSLEGLPEGKTLRVKAVLQNGEEVTGLSYSWI